MTAEIAEICNFLCTLFDLCGLYLRRLDDDQRGNGASAGFAPAGSGVRAVFITIDSKV